MASSYDRVIEIAFFESYGAGKAEVIIHRSRIEQIAIEQGVSIKNLGDVIYQKRYRAALPKAITDLAPAGHEWVIQGAGDAIYRFVLKRGGQILPSANRAVIKVPDATPSIIAKYALNDEQALLAKIRYNRLVDLFLRLTCYSLQNHLRTKVKDVGQIEIDELYLGIDRAGAHHVIPVQAKGKSDKLSTVQIWQDICFCRERFSLLHCRPVGAMFLPNQVIAVFEFIEEDDEIRVVEERHYQLVPADQISAADLAAYRSDR
ncbi:MAG: endonuclease [Fimbriimonas sp.]